VEDAARAIETSVTTQISSTESELNKVAADASAALAEPVETPALAEPPAEAPLAADLPVADAPPAEPVAAKPQLELGLEAAPPAAAQKQA